MISDKKLGRKAELWGCIGRFELEKQLGFKLLDPPKYIEVIYQNRRVMPYKRLAPSPMPPQANLIPNPFIYDIGDENP